MNNIFELIKGILDGVYIDDYVVEFRFLDGEEYKKLVAKLYNLPNLPEFKKYGHRFESDMMKFVLADFMEDDLLICYGGGLSIRNMPTKHVPTISGERFTIIDENGTFVKLMEG